MKFSITLAYMAAYTSASTYDKLELIDKINSAALKKQQWQKLLEAEDTAMTSVLFELMNAIQEMSEELDSLRTELRTKNDWQDDIAYQLQDDVKGNARDIISAKGYAESLFEEFNRFQAIEDHFWTNEAGYTAESLRCFD